MNRLKILVRAALFSPLLLPALVLTSSAATAEVKNLSVNGGIEDGKARLVIEALLKDAQRTPDKVLFATALEHSIMVRSNRVASFMRVKIDVLQGTPNELEFTLSGPTPITQITGPNLRDWSIRYSTNNTRLLVLRPAFTTNAPRQLNVEIMMSDMNFGTAAQTITPVTLLPPDPSLFNGYVKLTHPPELDVQMTNSTGLVPIELLLLPQPMRAEVSPDVPQPLAFRFLGSAYALPLRIAPADPDTRRVVLNDFKLTGQFANDSASFTLTANAQVRNPAGGTLELLSGGAALSELASHADWRMSFANGRYSMQFPRPGEFPITVKFNAAVRQSDGWNGVDFRVAPSALQPILLRGLAADTQFDFTGAARPERAGNDFTSFLPADGAVKLSWKEARKAEEGKLFYAAEMLSQIGVSPGLLRQVALLDFKVMQGELNRVSLLLRGLGEVTRVSGDQVLAWNVEPVPNTPDRRLVVQLNQPQKDAFALQVQLQSPLGAFPQTADAVRLQPEGATRFAGYFRIVNEGAVRLEVTQATGLSQVSPEQFPESDLTRAVLRAAGAQRFAYRFSSADYALRIQADQILPEVNVSQVTAYHRGQNEQTIDTEIELDVREAPLRELVIHAPRDFTMARISASGMADYFITVPPNTGDAELRVVYGKPVADRQVIQLRYERSQALSETNWILPRIEVVRAKSVRGHVGVSADAGFRLSPESTQGLTEIQPAFFPRKVGGLQTAFRLSEPTWTATMRVERLPQTVQTDALHLFSIGEGIAYGSSVLNYVVSGAPVSAFRVELANEYFNVEFTGKDVRNWQKTTNGFLVQLHTPVAGPYTLLASYERPFRTQGETLAFTGARPLDAQTEQGHTLVISAYQFQVQPADVSPGLLPIETGEVPAEYRLFFDAPILAAYRYTSRPFNLRLALSPLAQGDSLNQVVDRASLVTRISKEGQVLTEATYLVKNRGNPNFRLTVPSGVELWSATVNGATVVPVRDGNANLIPLPQRADPNAVLRLDLKLAAKSPSASPVSIAAPVVNAPVMLAEWKLAPDAGQRLVYRRGSLTPMGGFVDVSGFAQLTRAFSGSGGERVTMSLIAALALVGLAVMVWRWTTRERVYKFSLRYDCGLVIGLAAVLIAAAAFEQVLEAVSRLRGYAPRELTFLAPVQQPNSALNVEIGNVADKAATLSSAWPALLTLAVWVFGWLRIESEFKIVARLAGWLFLAWAALRMPNGASAFFGVVGAFLIFQVVIPALWRLWSLPRRPKRELEPPEQGGPAPAVAAVLLGGLMWLSSPGAPALAQAASPNAPGPFAALTNRPPLAESVTQAIRIEDKFAFAIGKIRWHGAKGQVLPLLFEPAVLTRLSYPTNTLKLIQGSVGSKRAQQLLAQENGVFDIEVHYQLQVAKRDTESGLTLPTQFGLVNQLSLTLMNLDVDVLSAQAVSVKRDAVGNNTVATLVLSPVNDTWIAWRPRSRDVRREKPVFYAEVTQLYVPSAGVIEGAHWVAVRPAQGELSELILDVPKGATITDVSGVNPKSEIRNPNANEKLAAPAASVPLVSLWRFDPDTRKLRVTLTPAQSRPFTLFVRSQVGTGPLPTEQAIGLLSVEGAANQIGLLGVATGNEVQLDSVTAEAFTAINLEDFPNDTTQTLIVQFPGLTVRRAFRYADVKASASLRASPVEADVRVTSQDTLSLGEDRTLLTANSTVNIARAGIFRLSFVMPDGFDVETISGAALSHWTELRTNATRTITLHLRGKTTGAQQFIINLAGPGVRATNGWAVPQLVLREASKHDGTLLIVPEQGMQPQVAPNMIGLRQLDPQRSGVRQKGVLAFQVLQAPWNLALNIEQVDPWVQVTSLQHATVSEAQIKITANLQYQIENTGLRALRVYLPTNAESVRFAGELTSDFLRVPGAVTNGLQQWEVKLQRRVIGPYLLQATYQTPLPEQATNAILHGLQATDVNLQRGFVTVQSGGRLQVRAGAFPAALQPTEWQSIPRALQQNLQAASANFAFRLVEPVFQLPLSLDRHEAAKLLPARVNSITFTSVISDEGVMLTHARLEMLPGDKRLLAVQLPPDARFWFAFANQNGVWPWREQNRILIPLEQQSRTGRPVPVEIFYSSRIGQAGSRALDLELLAPKFDLPLENIVWRVYLNEKWELQHWTGTLQLQQEQTVPRLATVNLQTYLQNEAVLQRGKTQEAEQMLALGNSALEKGDPQQARRAFQSAFGLSTHDSAFNEDARVQLNNLKLQQALVGLNVRQAAAANGDAAVLGGAFRDLRARKDVNYTQQDAKGIIDRNTADDNAAYMRLAEKLVHQQDAAVTSPTAIRASIPEQGRLLTFQRAVAVDREADLRIKLEASAVRTAGWGMRMLTLVVTLLVFVTFGWSTHWFRRNDLPARS